MHNLFFQFSCPRDRFLDYGLQSWIRAFIQNKKCMHCTVIKKLILLMCLRWTRKQNFQWMFIINMVCVSEGQNSNSLYGYVWIPKSPLLKIWYFNIQCNEFNINISSNYQERNLKSNTPKTVKRQITRWKKQLSELTRIYYSNQKVANLS